MYVTLKQILQLDHFDSIVGYSQAKSSYTSREREREAARSYNTLYTYEYICTGISYFFATLATGSPMLGKSQTAQ